MSQTSTAGADTQGLRCVLPHAGGQSSTGKRMHTVAAVYAVWGPCASDAWSFELRGEELA